MALKDEQYRNCLYFSANALSRLLNRMAEEEFRIVGLSPSHAFLVMTVNQRPGIQPGEISEELQLSPSTVTRLIQKMENMELMKRNSVGRATKVEPTEKSLELHEEIEKAWDRLIRRYSKVLGDRYTNVLTEMTYTALEKLE